MKYLIKLAISIFIIICTPLYAVNMECKLSSFGVYSFKYYLNYDLPAQTSWKSPYMVATDKKGLVIIFTEKTSNVNDPKQQIIEAYQTRRTQLMSIYQDKINEMKKTCQQVNSQIISSKSNSLTFMMQYLSCKDSTDMYTVAKVFHADGTYILQYFANPQKTTAAERNRGSSAVKQATLLEGCLLGGTY